VSFLKLNIIKHVKEREKKVKEDKKIKEEEKIKEEQKKVKEAPKVDTSKLLNIENVKNLLGNSEDIKYRDILINNNTAMPVNLIYIDGLVNSSDISDYVIKPLIQDRKIAEAQNLEEVIKLIQDGVLYFVAQTMTNDINKVISEITSASSVLLFSNQNTAFIFDTKGFDKRALMEPTNENVSKGPKDSFIENYRTNTAIIRRRIKDPGLIIEQRIIGERTKSVVGIFYINSIANDQLVQMVRDRLSTINTDSVLTTSTIEDALSDDLKSILPQVNTTERPDKFSADIIEGRVGIIVDGIPFGFIAPGTFNQFMQTPEDYSRKSMVSSFIRVIRFASLVLAIFLPSLYVAITTFHPEMIPTNIVLFIAKSRQGVAFPAAVETLGLIIAFEILYEAGLRIPKSVGQTVSIVGTLVVGQAAVEAKLVSPSIVVIIAATAIASFTIPSQDFSNFVRLWRILSTIFGIVLGLLGVVISIIFMTFSICKLESFGVSYMSPFVGNDGKQMLNDTFFRIPNVFNKMRPNALKTKDAKRRGD
jgi:spore germination protein KA